MRILFFYVLSVFIFKIHSQNITTIKIENVDRKIFKVDEHNNLYILCESTSDSIVINKNVYYSKSNYVKFGILPSQIWFFYYDSNLNLINHFQIFGKSNIFNSNFLVSDGKNLFLSFTTGGDSIFINEKNILNPTTSLLSILTFKYNLVDNDLSLISHILTGNTYQTYLKLIDSSIYIGINHNYTAYVDSLVFKNWKGDVHEYDLLLLKYNTSNFKLEDTTHIQSLDLIAFSDLNIDKNQNVILAMDCGGYAIRYNNVELNVSGFERSFFSLILCIDKSGNMQWYKKTNAETLKIFIDDISFKIFGNAKEHVVKFEDLEIINAINGYNIMICELELSGAVKSFVTAKGNNEKAIRELVYDTYGNLYVLGHYAGSLLNDSKILNFNSGINAFISEYKSELLNPILEFKGSRNEFLITSILDNPKNLLLVGYTTSDSMFTMMDTTYFTNNLGIYFLYQFKKLTSNSFPIDNRKFDLFLNNNRYLFLKSELKDDKGIIKILSIDGKLICNIPCIFNQLIDLKNYLKTGTYLFDVCINKCSYRRIFFIFNQ